MTHAASAPLAPGNALPLRASTHRQPRWLGTDAPQVSGTGTLRCCSPQPWASSAGAGDGAAATRRGTRPDAGAMGTSWAAARREHGEGGIWGLFVCVSPGIAPVRWELPAPMGGKCPGSIEMGAASSHGREVPREHRHPLQPREQAHCTGWAVRSSGVCSPPKALPVSGILVILLISKMFKGWVLSTALGVPLGCGPAPCGVRLPGAMQSRGKPAAQVPGAAMG